MSVFKSIYWQVPVMSQKLMGVWPYDDGTIYNRVMPICVYVALYGLVIPLAIRMVMEVGVHNLIALENLMGQMYLHGGLIKLTATIIYKKELKVVYDLIANDWKNTTDGEELKIMEHHARIGRKTSIFYAISWSITAASFLSLPTLKPLLDFVIPLENGSRPIILPYYAEYYIDQQKYFIPLLSQGVFSGLWSITVFITYDISYAMCVQHVISLFDIISLRLQRASKCANSPFASINHSQADRQVFKNLVEAIELHKIVIKNVNLLEEAYNTCWFFILMMNTVGLAGVLVLILKKLLTLMLE